MTLDALFIVIAQQMPAVVQAGADFSQSMTHHATVSTHSWQESVLVAVAGVVMIVTTIYTLRYLVRPDEAGDDHIKRRILEDGDGGSR